MKRKNKRRLKMPADTDLGKLLEKLIDTDAEIFNLQDEKSKIDSSLKDLKSKKEKIRESLLSIMMVGEMSIYTDKKYGEVSIRKSPEKYVVKDEDALMGILKEYDRVDEFCKTSVKIDKKLLNGFLKELRKCDSIPECVEIEPGAESVVFKPLLPQGSSKKSPVELGKSDNDKSFAMEEWDSI
jgi:hypothetical protein